MRPALSQMLADTAAKLMPTARASILVAMERIKRVWMRNESPFASQSSSPRDTVQQHLSAHKGEEAEGDKVIYVLDISHDGHPGKITDEGHERLKKSKEKTHPQRFWPQRISGCNAAADRHRKSVHGQPAGCEY